MTYEELILKIYHDEKVELILECLDCHSIHHEQGGNLICCARPSGDNKRSVQVKNDEFLNVSIRTTGFYGNIISLVSEFKSLSPQESKDWLEELCGYNKDTKCSDDMISELQKKKSRKKKELTFELPTIDERILNQYIYGNIKQFHDDGISEETLLNFNVGYDVESCRISIPIRDIEGNLIGVKGRATQLSFSKDKKFYFLYKTDQSKTMFNYYVCKEYCVLDNEVFVFESEKACMQTYEWGILNTLGIGSSEISIHQLELIKRLNVDNINLCYDEGLKNLDKKVEQFKMYLPNANIYVFDMNGCKKKSSPSDFGLDHFLQLYKNRKLY